jgi:lia operon protein LiaF
MKFSTSHMAILTLVFILIFLIDILFINSGGILFLCISIFLFYMAKQKKEKSWLIAGFFFLLFAFLSLWSLRTIPIIFIGYLLYLYVMKKPEAIPVDQAVIRHDNEFIGDFETPLEYKWEDLQLQKIVGSITIDATESILPVGRSVIHIQQAFGKTVVYVPYEVAVELHYKTIYGSCTFLQETPAQIINGKKVCTDGSENSKRTLTIIATTFLADVEVYRR